MPSSVWVPRLELIQFVPLVQHDAAQVFEPFGVILVRQHHRQGLGGGDEDIGHVLELLALAGGAGVSGAGLYRNVPTHCLNGSFDGLLNVPRQGPQGGDVKDLEAIGGLIQHFGDGTHDGGVGFAGTGGHLDQAAVTRQVGAPGFGLEG